MILINSCSILLVLKKNRKKTHSASSEKPKDFNFFSFYQRVRENNGRWWNTIYLCTYLLSITKLTTLLITNYKLTSFFRCFLSLLFYYSVSVALSAWDTKKYICVVDKKAVFEKIKNNGGGGRRRNCRLFKVNSWWTF